MGVRDYQDAFTKMINAKVVQADLKWMHKYGKSGPKHLLDDARYDVIAKELAAFIVKFVDDLEYTK